MFIREEEYISDEQQQKLDQEACAFAARKSGKLSKILIPHRHVSDDALYGQNDLKKLVTDPGYDIGLWPECKLSVLSKEIDPIKAFYQPLLDRMRKDYFNHAFEKHGYKTYDELKILPQFDVRKLCQDNTSLEKLTFKENDELATLAKDYGIEAFFPCLPEYTIRVHKKRMLYIKVVKKEDDNTYTIKFEDYLVENRQSCCVGKFIITSRHDDNKSVEWTSDEYVSYEDFLTQDIPDMKWSPQEEQLWYDVFGVYPMDDPTLIKLPIIFDKHGNVCICEDGVTNDRFIIWKKSDMEWVTKELKKYADVKVDIIGKGREEIIKLQQQKLDKLYPKFLTLIAIVNMQFIKTNTNVVFPDENNASIQVGDISVRTKSPIRILQ